MFIFDKGIISKYVAHYDTFKSKVSFLYQEWTFFDEQSRRSGRLHLSGKLAKPKVLTEG